MFFLAKKEIFSFEDSVQVGVELGKKSLDI